MKQYNRGREIVKRIYGSRATYQHTCIAGCFDDAQEVCAWFFWMFNIRAPVMNIADYEITTGYSIFWLIAAHSIGYQVRMILLL